MIQSGKGALLVLAALLFFHGLPGCSKDQSGGRKYTVGVVNLNHELDKVFQGFKDGLGRHGYNEKNVTYLYNGSRTDMSDIENDLKAMIDKEVDLILAITTPVAQKARQMTAESGIPVVFAPVYDPVASGIVESLVHPGGNLTGIKVGGNSGKALEWLLRIAPGVKNILVPVNSRNRATLQSLEELQAAAEKLDVRLTAREVDTEEELAAVFADPAVQADAIWLLNSNFLVEHMALFVDTAIKNRVPLGSSTSQFEDGVLISYGQRAYRTGEMAADLADKIIKGESPAAIPVEVTDFFLGINLKTASAIGIDISDDILHVADTIVRP